MFEEDFLARNLTIEVQISIRNTEKTGTANDEVDQVALAGEEENVVPKEWLPCGLFHLWFD